MNHTINKNQRLIIILSSLFLIIVIFFSPLAFYIFNHGFYKELYENNDVFSVLNKNDVLKLTEKIIDFFKFEEELTVMDPTSQIRFSNEELSSVALFSQDEIGHMYDVRALLARLFTVYYGSLVILIILFFLLIEKNFRNFLRKLGISFTISSSVALFIFVSLYLLANNFSFLFDKFHLIFFPQGNFIFGVDSLIIMLFPFGFFYDFFVRLAIGSGAFSAILLVGGIILMRVFRPVK